VSKEKKDKDKLNIITGGAGKTKGFTKGFTDVEMVVNYLHDEDKKRTHPESLKALHKQGASDNNENQR